MNSRNKPANLNPWNKSTQSKHPKTAVASSVNNVSSERKFKDAQKKLQASIQKHINEYDSSSDEENIAVNVVIEKIIANYTDGKSPSENLKRTESYLKDTLSSGATTCLICISKVKRDDQIWSCKSCYSFFHLMCIQRWSKDNISQKKQALEAQIVMRQVLICWGCPKCREEYGPDSVPKEYKCFCKKRVNPTYQALLVPHSCGEICGQELKPPCGHKCLLLCHPGPCPPCPVTVNAKCYCGAKPPRLQRCSDKYWSCGGSCGQLLGCGKHYCPNPCHDGECKPCSKKSIQKCMCKAKANLRDCCSPIWQCDKVCGKILDCGKHKCLDICHSGVCNVCLLSLPRTCPCGKSIYHLPCTEETPTCLDTCDKILECGTHRCVLKCHKDKCGTCLEIVEKQCRCGQHVKEVQCSKPFFCETKCKNIRDCNKHPCNKKCCDGNCSPCEKPCAKTLSCGNHKCTSVCHRGSCYPCNLTEVVTCFCGETKLTVPCGRKYRVKPPKCNLPCKQPPDCHHKSREFHRCHFGNCPSCKQICNRARETCDHPCLASCHDAVMVKIETTTASAPWEEVKPHKEKRRLPCPECINSVPVECLGVHDISNWPCHLAKPGSCFRPCGRLLPCENHKCTLPCHKVNESPNDIKAGSNCEMCEEQCTKERPIGCQHQCPKPCHPGPCTPCKQMVRIKCHCGLLNPYVICKEFLNPENQPEIQSCGNQCPKNYDCGHRCRANCHPGSCPDADLCQKRVKVFCKCKRIKKEFSCEVVKSNKASVECNMECSKFKEEAFKKNKALKDERKQLDELKNREELEKYLKKFEGKKKHRDKTFQSIAHNESFFKKYYFPLSTIGVVIISLVAFTFLSY